MKAIMSDSWNLSCTANESYHERFMKAITNDSAQLSCEVSTVALASLPKYLRPRHVIYASEIPQTGSVMIDRDACRELARNIITKTL